jgi:hypothetical protein
VGFLPKKSDKPAKLKTMEVRLGETAKKSASKAGKSAKKAPKPMSFTEWVEHYAKMSGGNPV